MFLKKITPPQALALQALSAKVLARRDASSSSSSSSGGLSFTEHKEPLQQARRNMMQHRRDEKLHRKHKSHLMDREAEIHHYNSVMEQMGSMAPAMIADGSAGQSPNNGQSPTAGPSPEGGQSPVLQSTSPKTKTTPSLSLKSPSTGSKSPTGRDNGKKPAAASPVVSGSPKPP